MTCAPARCEKTARAPGLFRRLPELEDELIRLAAHRGVPHACSVWVVRIMERVALALELEAGRGDFALHRFRIDAMECRRIAHARARLCGVIDHDVRAARLEGVERRLV